MGKAITLAAAAYKLVWVRVVLFFLLPCGAAFVALAKAHGFDTDPAKWAAMGLMGHSVFWCEVFTPGALAMAAFIDNSMARAREKHDKAKSEAAIANMKAEEAP